LIAAVPAFALDQGDSNPRSRSTDFRGQAAACRQHANQIRDTETQEKPRELADKFIVLAALRARWLALEPGV